MTVVPVSSLDRSRVEFPGTVTPSSVIAVQAAVAAGTAVYAVTEQISFVVAVVFSEEVVLDNREVVEREVSVNC